MHPGCVIRRPVERNRFKTETTIKIQNKKTPLTTNTFLVRFQGPQDARAAIREKNKLKLKLLWLLSMKHLPIPNTFQLPTTVRIIMIIITITKTIIMRIRITIFHLLYRHHRFYAKKMRLFTKFQLLNRFGCNSHHPQHHLHQQHHPHLLLVRTVVIM